MDSNVLDTGINTIKQAVQADNADNYQQAFTLYLRGCQYLKTAMKYEKNPNIKAAIRTKVEEYVSRLEALQKVLKTGEDTSAAADSSSNGKSKEKKKSAETKDDEQMKSRLSSAIVQEKPKVKWSDVAGLKVAKSMLQEAVIYPIRYPQFFQGERKPWKGILLYGPPGTGKSFLAKAVANEADSTFFSISSSDLMSKFVGEGEKNVRNLFELAKEKRPSIIFIAEIDALVADREGGGGGGGSDAGRRVLTEFLVQMDGVGHDLEDVLILGATNTPWTLDGAIRRRFEKLILIPLPDLEARRHLFLLHVGKTPNNLDKNDIAVLAERTDGFSGSDIKVIVHDALYEPLRTMQDATHFKKIQNPEDPSDFSYVPCSPGDPSAEEHNLRDLPPNKMRLADVSREDFLRVLAGARKSVTPAEAKRHEEWTSQFGQEG